MNADVDDLADVQLAQIGPVLGSTSIVIAIGIAENGSWWIMKVPRARSISTILP
jgi:hypothetical protein